MKIMKKKLFSLVLLAAIALCAFAGCDMGSNSDSSGNSTPLEVIDYVAETKLDMNSDSQKQEVTVKQYVDGDTTHFNVPKTISADGVLKARYTAINTPESTGSIEAYGKKASNFTKEKLKGASSIIVESDSTDWETDSNGRFLVWVWYKPIGGTDYRNLNLEILQNGLAYANKSNDSRYGTACMGAFSQSREQKLNLWSGEKDPDFYYGDAQPVTLKELRINPEKYLGIKVAFECTVTSNDNFNVYVETYDESTDLYYGISIFYGYNHALDETLTPGNLVRIVGKLSYYEAGGTYQVSDLKYNEMKPNDPSNTIKLEGDGEISYHEITAAQFNGKVTVDMETQNIQTGEMVITPTEFDYAALAMNTSVSMKNLKVVKVYTTTNESSSNKGAMTLTCEVDGQTIDVRTAVLYHADKSIVTEDEFLGETIDVKGFVDYYDGSYQIKVFYLGAITIH